MDQLRKERFIEGVQNGWRLKVMFDMTQIRVSGHHPDKKFMDNHSLEMIAKLIEEYKYIDEKPAREAVRELAELALNFYENQIVPNINRYDEDCLKMSEPEQIVGWSDDLQKMSHLQYLVSFNEVKLHIEEALEENKDIFKPFEKDGFKIDLYDIAWNVNTVCGAVVPTMVGMFPEGNYHFISIESMSPLGKENPELYITLTKELGYITDKEVNAIKEYLKDKENMETTALS